MKTAHKIVDVGTEVAKHNLEIKDIEILGKHKKVWSWESKLQSKSRKFISVSFSEMESCITKTSASLLGR